MQRTTVSLLMLFEVSNIRKHGCKEPRISKRVSALLLLRFLSGMSTEDWQAQRRVQPDVTWSLAEKASGFC